MAAAAFWKARRINDPADDNDIRLVRIRVNGPAAHGLDAANMWLPRAQKAFGVPSRTAAKSTEAEVESFLGEAAEATERRAAAKALEQMGFVQSGAVESGNIDKNSFTDGLRAYQRSRGLPETGKLDDDTFYSITERMAATEALQTMGFIGAFESTENAFTEGLRAYQRSRGLPETGKLDDDTFYSITDPDEWRQDESENLSEPIKDLDGTVSVDIGPTPTKPSLQPLLPNQGTGTQEIGSAAQLSPEEINTFAKSKESYASYEFERGRTDSSDHFIPFSIVGNDDRVVVTNTTVFPARAIVQINFGPRGSQGRHLCSGAMISKNTVLTAGHCVHNGTRAGEWYTDYVVYPGRNTGSTPFGRCGAIRLFALKGWVNAGNSDEARYYDLGTIKLDCDVGARTGYFGVRILADNENDLPTKVQGYAGDKVPAGRQWLSEDKLRVLQSFKGFYQNDTYGGTSGSPVYSGNDYTIIGVHTNGLHDGEPWKSNNAFTRITPERLREIAGWVQQ